jgi:serine/threonine-protein kinase
MSPDRDDTPVGTAAGEGLLDEVVTAFLKARDAGAAPDREHLLARYPELTAELREFFADQDELDRLNAPLRLAARVVRAAADTSVDLPGLTLPLPAEPPESFGDYEVRGELGRGGMGVVCQARQKSLGRVVALKMVRAAELSATAEGRRFRNEAETAAALDHPHIVPVYEVGEHQGRLFFSMKLVEGGSLALHLERFRDDPLGVARLLAAVAEAVHHAHQRGVLHRDLKPSNILLDGEGRPYVADFGLARRVETDSSLTHSGALVGTPSYMAPEQAAGRKGAVTTATDVYGLGAVLYALLTGRAPFQAETVLDTLAQVREREPERPGRINPRASRDLETICLKCLHKDPARRYATALELAEDLGRFLRHEPIRARPVGRRERVWKWARRRPALAALVVLGGLSAVTLVSGSLVYNGLLQEAVRQAEANEARALGQQHLAEANETLAADRYRAARDTLNRMLARLDGRSLAEVPKLLELKRDLLEDALAFYQGVLREQDNPDPTLRLDAAQAYTGAGFTQYELGRAAQAEASLLRAVALYEGLPADLRQGRSCQRLLAFCYTLLGERATEAGQFDPAEGWFKKGLRLREQLARADPQNPDWQREVARSYNSLGGLGTRRGRGPDAEAAYKRSVELHAALVRAFPQDEEHRHELAETYQNLGLLLSGLGRRQESEAIYARAAGLLEPLAAAHPELSGYSLALAAVYLNWGGLLRDTGRRQEALRLLGKAVDLCEALLRVEPRMQVARVRALNAHGHRAQAHEQLGRFADAAGDWDRVVALEAGKKKGVYRMFRALALARAGEHAPAAAEAGALEKAAEAREGFLYNLACVYALAVPPARSDARLPTSERAVLAERYAGQAVAALHKLRGQGYFQDARHRELLHSDPDLQALRECADFRELLSETKRSKQS